MILFVPKTRRRIAFLLLFFFTGQMIHPSIVYALTGGPTQPEMRSFQQAGVNEMVDLFSGDFSYNIPLFELPGPNGGYPFNLSYQSGITMEQEATWVGLGWSLNPGAITRQVRGLPDDFNGEEVTTEMNIKPSRTIGAGGGIYGELFGMDFLKGKLGVTYRYNNYKGFGYAIDGSLGYAKSSGTGFTAGLAVSLDPDEGVGLAPSIGLQSKTGTIGLSAGYHSAMGLQKVAFNTELKGEDIRKGVEDKDKYKGISGSGGSAGLSFSFPGYTPQINFSMKSKAYSGTFKWGVGAYGPSGGVYITGFYNEQELSENTVRRKAYGYLNLQEAGRESLMDVNREKDGIISKETPNLAIPNLTYDIYSVTGQGISGMYRPMRNDYGTTWDPSVAPFSGHNFSLGLGLDANPPGHWGINAEIMLSTNESGRWGAPWFFAKRASDTSYEPWCFKVHGEKGATPIGWHTQIGGDKPAQIAITDKENPRIGSTWTVKDSPPPSLDRNDTDRSRLGRNQVIQTYSVKELKGEEGRQLFPQFKNEFYEGTGTTLLDRDLPDHHIGAYTAWTPEGVRYNYGIPARNIEQREVTLAAQQIPGSTRVNVRSTNGTLNHVHPNTDNFSKITTTPRYAHSYLLTSILGPDYIDVTGDGITEDDLGYWVRFTYRRVTKNYQWRDPYTQAHRIEGWKSDRWDDKGQYTYGVKEIWYLERAETKSHIAEFKTSPRTDGKGVAGELQDNNSQKGESLYKLDEIKMYSRIGNIAGSVTPIQSVNFEYDTRLCTGIENGEGGKLTLLKLKFKYGLSTKGEMNPYVFTYGENPAYSKQSFDRWGNYKPCPAGDPMRNIDFPYVNQDPANKATLDREISAWSLKEISLPNGGTIKVDYEVDDYAYVQHLPAMQMMEIVPETGSAATMNLSSNNLKLCFKLEKPIEAAADWTASQQADEVKKYLDLRRGQLYFKCLVSLRTPGEKDNQYQEYISGYIDIDPSKEMGLKKEGQQYTRGYFHVKSEKSYHPISMRAWQHLRTNQPELSNNEVPARFDNVNSGSVRGFIRALSNPGIVDQLRKMFQGFNSYCHSKDFGKEIVLNKSWIRLFSPDKIKYGGGLRVKQLTQTDEWDEEGIYGSHYDYTTDQGGIISSGVAAYEPMAGGEEISLRQAKKYVNSVPLRADNNLYFEYPINESYYPGAQVGYSKVTVRSLVAAAQAGLALNHIETSGRKIIPTGNNVTTGVSGVSVHEFYTAREFPVLTDETSLQPLSYQYDLRIPFLGSRSENRLAGSQGYSVITNDMHGKPKKVSQYRVDKNGAMEAQPVSWVSYKYRTKEDILDGERIMLLENRLKADNQAGTLSVPANPGDATHFLGQETDFFLDTRQFRDTSWSMGINLNIDIIFLLFITIPIPTFFPNVTTTASSLHTAVTNKAIFRSGILETTEAYNEGSLLKTKILTWDINTGTPLLQQINNNYDAPVYSLTTPAYTKYEEMGSAAKNLGMEFTIRFSRIGSADVNRFIYTGYLDNGAILGPLLMPGDEIIAVRENNELMTPRYRLVYNGKMNGHTVYESVAGAVPDNYDYKYTAKIVRSGYRNMLTPTTQTVTSLSDPRIHASTKTFTKTVRVPK